MSSLLLKDDGKEGRALSPETFDGT